MSFVFRSGMARRVALAIAGCLLLGVSASGSAAGSQPIWKWVVSVESPYNRSTLYLLQSTSRGSVRLTQPHGDGDEDILPTWSPDGRYVAFDRNYYGRDDIYVLDTVSRSLHRLLAGGGDIVWASNGRSIALRLELDLARDAVYVQCGAVPQ
jgi:Tol biopolymer transport system component